MRNEITHLEERRNPRDTHEPKKRYREETSERIQLLVHQLAGCSTIAHWTDKRSLILSVVVPRRIQIVANISPIPTAIVRLEVYDEVK